MTCFYFINKDSIYQQLYICRLVQGTRITHTGAAMLRVCRHWLHHYRDVNSYGCAARVCLHLAEHRT